MNILILTGYDDNIQELGDACAVGQREYAERNGYAFEVVRSYEEGSHPSWQKLRLLKEHIGKYDAICWFDADTVITNCDVKIENLVSPNHVLTLSADWCAPVDEPDTKTRFVSMGNFILRQAPDTIRFLELAQENTQFMNRACWEQDAVMRCMNYTEWFKEQICILPRGAMNAVDKDVVNVHRPWQPGDLLCHLTGLGEVKNRMVKVPFYDAARKAGYSGSLPEYYAERIPEPTLSDIESRAPWIPSWWEGGWCMDKRHILALSEAVKRTGSKNTLEIGSYSGCSATAFIGTTESHFVDVAVQGLLYDALKAVPGSNVHNMKGEDFLRGLIDKPALDFIFVDGEHDLKSVTPEVENLLKNPPKVVAAHDVNSDILGHGDFHGAAYLRKEFIRQGWLCCWDHKKRPGEYTERGFFLATRDPGTFETLKQVLRDTCGGYETEL